MVKKTEKSSSRDRLLEVAKKLFAERGYDGVSIRDIVQAAEVNVSLVSYYFGGKEELFRECLSQFGTRNLDIARETLIRPADAAEFRVRLSLYMERIFCSHIADIDMHRIVDREVERDSHSFRDLLMGIYVEVFRTVINYFDAARNSGVCRKECDPVILASMLQGFMRQEIRIDPLRKELLGPTIHDPKHRQFVIDCFLKVLSEGACALASAS